VITDGYAVLTFTPTLFAAVAEPAPLECLERTVRSSAGDRVRLRNPPLQAPGGLSGTMPGTDPLRDVIRGVSR